MKRILLSRPMPPATIEAASQLFEVEIRDSTRPMSPAEIRSGLAVYDGMMVTLGDQVSAEILQDFGRPRCKILANFGVGYNHIDTQACRNHGVTVTNTPGAVTDATADVAMTLILMACRRAGEAERLVRSGQWEGWHPTQMLGLHVTGRKLGVIGMGRIGQAVARRCHFGFGMEVGYFNRSEKETEVPATRHETLEGLAAWADILVVATPASPETHHLVGASVLGAMQPHGVLVNIARGDIVDEAALIAALEARSIGAVGLDVYEHEPLVPEALMAFDNAVLLPHLGTSCLDVREDMGAMAVENLRAFFAGEDCPNKVN
ncbi:hydroxypyruvate reductase [Pseudooceanicola antarcticus]|uniref:D-glycerate dehydrogenase n=1 Tax=Pseudooceanicola antarcticus TaxID=1247613 RepID=A0A285IRW9_9RHOB|nr:D-glycerate dehydrogenase [Pseudooceanicola antarcticus]PJE31857.1 D-glycerate dehydrogenase [Pseudooceanicola antarcticus]SNY50583.1 hydroxypyruvate reductase [Pseudooceanicola antarcticus]